MTDIAEYFATAEMALGTRYRLERVMAADAERVLFVGIDRVLNRRVSIRINFYTDDATRAWFLREAEALAQLDHPAIRHVYDAGVVGQIAYRVGNWIDGESLEHAAQRGPRPDPDGARPGARSPERARACAHAGHPVPPHRARVASSLSHAGRGTVTDLRFSS